MDEPEEDESDDMQLNENTFIAGTLDVPGQNPMMGYGTKTVDEMGMQIHEGKAVSGQVFEDVEDSILSDEN